jgi:hypothetical protein
MCVTLRAWLAVKRDPGLADESGDSGEDFARVATVHRGLTAVDSQAQRLAGSCRVADGLREGRGALSVWGLGLQAAAPPACNTNTTSCVQQVLITR